MRPLALVLVPPLAAALACGSVRDRAGCATSADCPAGQGCAPTSDGNVCWPDAVPPVVSGVTASCGGPCVRDGTLTVTARVTDDREVGAVEASVDLDAHVRRVALARSTAAGDPAGTYRAALPLGGWAFPAFERQVVARVTARDGARNEVAADAAAVAVARVRWSVPLETGSVVVPTAPALKPDGEIVVAGINGKLYFFKPDGTAARDTFAIPSASIAQAPSIGATAIWVAAGNRVFAVKPDGTAVLNGAGCDTGGAVVGPPAVSDSPAPDVAFAASAGATEPRVWAVAPTAVAEGFVAKSAVADPFSSGPAANGRANVVAVSSSISAATVRNYAYDGAFSPGGTAVVGQVVAVPLAIDPAGNTWSAASDLAASAMKGTSPTGANVANIALAASATGSVVIASGGDVVISQSNTLRRFSPAGVARWPTPPTLGGVGLTPIALAGGDAAFLVPTKVGTLHAVDGSGAVLWSGTLASAELREGNVFTPAGAAIGTAYFTSADGVLHAVAVDGRLDPAAPWPKVWHDARNTGNAATAP